MLNTAQECHGRAERDVVESVSLMAHPEARKGQDILDLRKVLAFAGFTHKSARADKAFNLEPDSLRSRRAHAEAVQFCVRTKISGKGMGFQCNVIIRTRYDRYKTKLTTFSNDRPLITGLCISTWPLYIVTKTDGFPTCNFFTACAASA